MTGIIENGIRAWGLSVPEDTAGKLSLFFDFLTRKNREINLTRITGPEDAARLHFLDSLSLLRLMDISDRSVIDVGCGAGFPGLPLAVAAPGCAVTLIDSTRKKADFVRSAAESLGLSNVKCAHLRAEEASRTPEYRERFDIAVSRAVAKLSTLSELCLPFVRPGGVFVAYKGPGADPEKEEASGIISLLGGKLSEDFEYGIPGADIQRRLIVISKVRTTPTEYPRKFSKMK